MTNYEQTLKRIQADEPVRTRYMPRDAGQPYKVIAVCLLFVYAKRPSDGISDPNFVECSFKSIQNKPRPVKN